MTPHAPDMLALLRRDAWFGGLDPAIAAELLRLSVQHVLRPGDMLFLRGDEPDGLFVVIEGQLHACGWTEAGREVVLARLEPGTWFGEVSMFDGMPRGHDVAADRPAAVLQVPGAEVTALLAHAPQFWRDIGALMAHKTRQALMHLQNMSMQPPQRRRAPEGEVEGTDVREAQLLRDIHQGPAALPVARAIKRRVAP